MIKAIGLGLLLLAAGTEPKAASELLTDFPEEWRFERIDFPLPFAPDLKYDGFEELRFAPGMFNAKSDTYFTYVFALKITNDVTINAAFLKSFLETYYRGLCKSVAEGTEFAIDVSKVSAVVREDHYEAQDSRHFHATLDSFDPFVTGEPIKLYLEIIAYEPSKNDNRLFAAVSPKKDDSPVWTLLREFKRKFPRDASQSKK